MKGPKTKNAVLYENQPAQKIPRAERRQLTKTMKKFNNGQKLLNDLSENIEEGIERPEDISEEAFLKDLMWVYQKWGGRTKLLNLVRQDEKVRKDFLKTFFALQNKIIESKERNRGKGGDNKGKLLIFKNLYAEDKVIDGAGLLNILDPGMGVRAEKKQADLFEAPMREQFDDDDDIIEDDNA